MVTRIASEHLYALSTAERKALFQYLKLTGVIIDSDTEKKFFRGHRAGREFVVENNTMKAAYIYFRPCLDVEPKSIEELKRMAKLAHW